MYSTHCKCLLQTGMKLYEMPQALISTFIVTFSVITNQMASRVGVRSLFIQDYYINRTHDTGTLPYLGTNPDNLEFCPCNIWSISYHDPLHHHYIMIIVACWFVQGNPLKVIVQNLMSQSHCPIHVCFQSTLRYAPEDLRSLLWLGHSNISSRWQS